MKEITEKLRSVNWSRVEKPDIGKIQNTTLRNIISQNLYKDASTVGNGSLADAIRYEKWTWLLVGGKSHLKSGDDNRNALINVYDSLNAEEKKIADILYAELSNSLNGN